MSELSRDREKFGVLSNFAPRYFDSSPKTSSSKGNMVILPLAINTSSFSHSTPPSPLYLSPSLKEKKVVILHQRIAFSGHLLIKKCFLEEISSSFSPFLLEISFYLLISFSFLTSNFLLWWSCWWLFGYFWGAIFDFVNFLHSLR